MTDGSEARNARRNEEPPAGRVGPQAGPLHILLAEDDDEMRKLLAAALRADGYAVEEAYNGMDLLAKVARSLLHGSSAVPVDLVITDIRMPGFSGLEVLAALRETNRTVPVILITAFGDLETHQEARRLGANAIFDKPFDVDDLRTAVLSFAPAH